jgi:hypothetical protein
MKKIIALGLAVAGVVWAIGRSKKSTTTDHWAAASDKV